MNKQDDVQRQLLEQVRGYHQRSKHALGRYARGPDTIDWSAQPDSFRRYQGAEQIELPLQLKDNTIAYNEIYRSCGIESQAFSLTSISQLLRLSLGLSAWKEYQGSRWSLRCNPSSGNLHPTEAYLIAQHTPGLGDGIYHYNSYAHVLEQRGACVEPAADSNSQAMLLLALTSITWREAWKYGERAFRYCQLDIGHAMAAIRFATALLGWESVMLNRWGDDDIARLTGIQRNQDFIGAELETPDLLLCLKPKNSPTPVLAENPDELLALMANCRWNGTANVLDPKHHYHWPVIDDVISNCAKPRQPEAVAIERHYPSPLPSDSPHSAALLIERRRSAQTYDRQTSIDKLQFFRMMDMLLPRSDTPPWDSVPWPPAMHLLLFVHRVRGLQPGLYLLLRNTDVLEQMKSTLLPDKFDWQTLETCPKHIPLYHLLDANCQSASATLSCHQRIASDGVFSVSMLAEFDTVLADGAWRYRQLYWEAGYIGQVLYLEAEAIDLQGTGIGCYFDDVVHEMLGISDSRLQAMYHFTLGGAYNDPRLRSLAAYAHLPQRR